MATETTERMAHTGGDQFVPPRYIPRTEGAFLRNVRTGEVWPWHDTQARMGDQFFEATDEVPEWYSKRERVNEAKAAAALQLQLDEQAKEEEVYMKGVQRQAAVESLGEDKSKAKAKRAEIEVPSFMGT